MTDLNDRQIEIARAAYQGEWRIALGVNGQPYIPHVAAAMRPVNAAHIARNPPAVTIAYAEVAKAAKELRYSGSDGYRTMLVSDDDFDALMSALTHLDEVLEANSHDAR